MASAGMTPGQAPLPHDDAAAWQRHLPLALAAAGLGLWTWDIAGRCVRLSPEARAIGGHALPGGPGAALRASRVLAALHPEDRRHVLRALQATLAGQPLAVECRYRRPDGSTLWLGVTALREPDAAGAPLRLVGTLQDIGARKQAEAALAREAVSRHQRTESALRDSERRLALALQASDMGVWEWTLASGRVRWSADAALRLGRHPARQGDDESSFDAVLAHVHRDDRAGLLAARDAVLRGSGSFRVELRLFGYDGRMRWVRQRGIVDRAADGTPLRLLGTVLDVTERRHIEAELARHRQHLESEVAKRTRELQLAVRAREEREEFLRSVADNIPDMLGYWDAQRVLRFANRPYREWFGGGAEVLGRTREQVVGAPAADAGEAAFAAAMAGEAQHFEYAVHNDAGGVRHAWIHYIPHHQPGGVAGVFVLVSDISEVKQAGLRLQALNEQLVAARDRAEAANRAKSAFLANMSHEIRTPMNAIIGLAHLMQRDLRDPVAVERLAKISDAAHHLLDVINDVLDLSKIESGKLRLADTEFEIESVLGRACALVADRAHGKGLALVVQSEGVPPLLRGDPTRVSQALLNLMGNAVKFTDHGTVALRCELQDSDADTLLLRFSVRDTGVGVPADKIATLFNAFEQADTTSTRRFGGTGLGLAITRRLAQLMGGDVGVDSVPGQGSCFWFSARFGRAASRRAAAPGTAQAIADRAPEAPRAPQAHEIALRQRHAGARVLLAEDNSVNLEVASELLRAVGLVVDVAHDGAQAVQLAQRRAYDLVLMDMQMPELDGLAATRALRGMPQHARTPILAMTANAFGDDRQACLDAGMDDHIAKPVEPELLYALLSRWLPAGPAPAGAVAGQDALAGPPWPAAPAGASTDAEARAATEAAGFTGVPGLTMSRALLYLPGREQLFVRVLRQFADNYAEGQPGLEAALAAGRWVEAGRLLHSLRGACGAVGASELMAQAEQLEARVGQRADESAPGDGSAPAPAGAPEQALAETLQQGLRALVAAIRQRLSERGTAVPPAPPPPPAEMLAAIDDLAGLLAVADFRANARWRELEPQFASTFGEDSARSVALPLRTHDYDAAQAALDALRQRLAGHLTAPAVPAGRQ